MKNRSDKSYFSETATDLADVPPNITFNKALKIRHEIDRIAYWYGNIWAPPIS